MPDCTLKAAETTSERRRSWLGAGHSWRWGRGGTTGLERSPPAWLGIRRRRSARVALVGAVFSFPNPVNEKAARLVAGVVCVLALVTLATRWYWLLRGIHLSGAGAATGRLGAGVAGHPEKRLRARVPPKRLRA